VGRRSLHQCGIEGVVSHVDQACDTERVKAPVIQEDMEQLLSLASRTIKGEAYKECGDADYRSPMRLDKTVHEFFAEKMMEVV
jgi:hypothetical protein